jgi:glycosyltransferase 2 family protein
LNIKKALAASKWLWMTIVILGVAVYFSRNFYQYLGYIKNISIMQILLSAGLLIVGKLILTELSRQSVNSLNWKPTYSKMFHLYSITQLSKYLPGGIWHFVGRFGIYRVNGLDNREASQSMVVENIWLVSSAFLFGSIVYLINLDTLPMIGMASNPQLNGLLILICFLVWITTNLLINHFLIKQKFKFSDIILKIFIQSAVWLFIGLSFFILFPSQIMSVKTASVSIGGFSIGWALGYITIFAPSGIGVREAFITAALAAYMKPQEAAFYAAVSRVVWIITEIGLGIFSELVFGSGKIANVFRPNP